MLHIVLMILKITGIILLAILGLLLGLFFLVLLAPIRYRGRGSYYGELKGCVRATWLLHMVALSAAYQNSQVEFTVRLFGIRFFKQKENIDLKEAVKDGEAEIQNDVSEAETVESEELLQIQEKNPDVSQSGEKPADPKEEEQKQEKRQEKKIARPEPAPGVGHGEAAKKPNRVVLFIRKIKDRIRDMAGRIREIEKKWDEFRDFIGNEENKKTFALIVRQLKRLARHVSPKRIRGQVIFGFDDPYYTGQVLSLASILYPYYYKSLKLYPVFDQVRLEGEIDLKGRIRMATVLVLLVRVYFDKNFRILLKRFR